MDIQVGDKVIVIHREPPVCREPLKEGEVVTVVAMRPNPNTLGGLVLSVCLDGEAQRHGVHSSDVILIKSKPIAEMSVAEMVDRYLSIHEANDEVLDDEVRESLENEIDEIYEALPKTRSNTYKDIVMKLRFATELESSFYLLPTDFLETLAHDEKHLRERTRKEAELQLQTAE